MLTNLIVATLEEAPAILQSQGHASIWPTLEAKGIDQVKLASLRFILKGEPPEDNAVIQYMKSFDIHADGGAEGPWIDSLPEDLVGLLAAIPVADIPNLATAWANTEEAQLDRWLAADVEPVLGELSALAAGAVAQGKRLLLWVCL
jgi:hypothetical protein